MSIRDRKHERFFQYLKQFRLNSRIKQMAYDQFDHIRTDPDVLNNFVIYMDEQQIRAILEILHNVGIHHINYTPEEFVVLWNNQNVAGFSYKARVWAEGNWLDQTRAFTEQGSVSKTKAIKPALIASKIKDPGIPVEQVKWDISANYFDLINQRFMSNSDDSTAL
jgi:hypothetical protein